MQEKQKVKQVVFTIPEEASIEEECEMEDGVVKVASRRPQRMRNPPKWHGDSVITIE
jgi:predicted secreted protein